MKLRFFWFFRTAFAPQVSQIWKIITYLGSKHNPILLVLFGFSLVHFWPFSNHSVSTMASNWSRIEWWTWNRWIFSTWRYQLWWPAWRLDKQPRFLPHCWWVWRRPRLYSKDDCLPTKYRSRPGHPSGHYSHRIHQCRHGHSPLDLCAGHFLVSKLPRA